ncbi:eCIS core domain-containing protein [Deinococcus sp. 6YEL10]|uniref:eCIS core domain-containing protein n=1 Tax=Deinococcus sp. 6YEL10 TaxID=2745870 RepID=UPI001E2DD230
MPVDPLALTQQAVQRFTARPRTLQRQAVLPVLRAAALDRQEQTRLSQQQTQVQRQITALGEVTPVLRPAEPLTAPAKPITPGDWVTVIRLRAEEVAGRPLDARSSAGFTALQRQVAQTLAQGFRSDRGDAQARYAAYGEHLATLQRHPVSAPVARVVLGQIPPVERLPLQRAVDETLQRFHAQEQASLNFDTRQTLQRQLAELDAEATQPVLQRIQARRGSGNPLPEAIQRHLEHGLNHDLSRVRIHDDAEADKLAKSVGAVAFTTGTDIFFRSGHFRPNTKSGLALLAHEVTHTVQQAQGRVAGGIDPDAGLETEAQVTGARLAKTFTPSSFLKTPSGRSRQISRSLAPLTPSHAAQRLAVQRQTVQRSLWGDWWKGFQNKAVEGALELAARVPNGGIIVSAFKRSQAVFQKIFANPGAFFARLFTGVRNGFQLFRKNIATHLETALRDWLAGTTVAATGGFIAFPKSLDAKELLGFGMNLVGLNTGALITRLGQRYGAANVQKAQGQLEVLQQARGGLHKLNEFRSLDGKAKEGMLSAARGYAIQTVAQQAVVWVSGFLATGGLGPVAKAAFSLISTFLQNARTFGQVATGVLDSVEAIANGRTDGAAKTIETNLGRVTGLVLKFVSKLLGLDKIGGALRKGLAAVQKPINTAIDRIVGSKPVQAVFQKLKATGTAVTTAARNTWKTITGSFARIRFKAGNEDHSIWLDIKNDRPRIMIASTPREATAQLDVLKGEVEQQYAGRPERAKLRGHLARGRLIVRDEMNRLSAEFRKANPNRNDPNWATRFRNSVLGGSTTLACHERLRQEVAPVFAALGRSTGFAAPVIGVHPVPNPPGYVQVDLGRRESHHVPAYQLSQVYGKAYAQLEQGLSQVVTLNPDAQSSALLKRYQSQFAQRHTRAQAASANRGVGMRAVLMHANAHRLDPDIAVHAQGMSASITNAIRQDAQKEQKDRVTILTTVKKKLQVPVNPKTDHWQGFLNTCFEYLTGRAPAQDFLVEAKSAKSSEVGSKIATLGKAQQDLTQMDRVTLARYRRDLSSRTNQLIKKSFDDAFANGYAAVCQSLRKSRYDGSSQEIEQALLLLSDPVVARASWDALGITPDIT